MALSRAGDDTEGMEGQVVDLGGLIDLGWNALLLKALR